MLSGAVVLIFVIFIAAIVILVVCFDSSATVQKNKKNCNTQNITIAKQNNEVILSFPEYNPEEYQRQKKERNDKALNGCEFWDGINIDFQENIELFYNKKCPYCSILLPERKGKSYKCPSCGGKIYRLKDLVSDFEGVFTQEQKEIREQLKKELSKRKKFLKILYEAFSDCTSKIVNIKQPLNTDNKKDNINNIINILHNAKPHLKAQKNVNGLRMSRFYEAKMQELYGNKEDTLKSWLAVAYIDLWGFYNYLYNYKNEYTNIFDEKDEEIFNKIKLRIEQSGGNYYQSFEEYKQKQIEEYNKSKKPFDTDNALVAPYVLKKIFSENSDLVLLQKLFYFSAKEIISMVAYTVPITPEKAWEKLLTQYYNN